MSSNKKRTKTKPAKSVGKPALPVETSSPKPSPEPIKPSIAIIIPSHLAMISEIEVVSGYVKIKQFDGKEQVWPAERLGFMAEDCLNMLRR